MAQRSAVVIDDEPDVTTYLSTLLADNGWAVRVANSANEGLELLKQARPDVVLLDVMMPERGGLNTLLAIRKEPALEGLPVVLVTGIQEQLTSDYRAFLDRFKHHQPDGYIEKPVDTQKLLGMLDSLVKPAN
jgi:two-component system alkaline phosphatase synthesis response regulator PhoP